MTNHFFEDLKDHLHKGIHKKGHPFRYAVLGTTSLNNTPAIRNVVLRQVSDALTLRFYTDARSSKIAQIKANNQVSILFYHPKEMLQIKVEGIATLITDKDTLQKYWSGVQPNSRKDYCTTAAPGSSVTNSDAVAYLSEENHFIIVEITPTNIEYLKLKRPNHIRIQFSKKDANWNGTFLVP